MMSRIIYTMHADLIQRIRQQNYLAMMLSMMVLTMLYFPASDAAYQTVSIGDLRGMYNSPWMGASLALLNLSFLPLICFYLVRGTVERDRTLQVGELIASTKVSKSEYTLGKWLSNAILMLGLLGCMSLTAVFVQLYHGESYAINLLQLFLPQVLYVVPILLLVAALAVLFDVTPYLKGGLGNVVYFFLWSFSLIHLMFGGSRVSHFQSQMFSSVADSDLDGANGVQIGISVSNRIMRTYEWSGLTYSASDLLFPMQMLVASAITVLLAVWCFDRFKRSPVKHQPKGQGMFFKFATPLISYLDALFQVATKHYAFTRLVRHEWLLMVKGWPAWWYFLTLSMVLLQIVLPIDVLRAVILPTSWLLCVLVISPLGQREKQQGTQQFVFNAPSLMTKQFPAMLVAGSLVLLMTVSGGILRFLLSGEFYSVFMLIAGTLFLSTLALACGVLTQTSRTFEILFTLIWYMGPMNQLVYLDFVGVDILASEATNAPFIFIGIAALFALAAFVVRHKQASI